LTPKQKYNAILSQKLINEFQKRNLEGHYCETKEAALQKALELIPKDAVISCGGSATLKEIGPKNVIIIAGMNKVEPNLDAAIQRVKKTAARMIMLKFKDYIVAFVAILCYASF